MIANVAAAVAIALTALAVTGAPAQTVVNVRVGYGVIARSQMPPGGLGAMLSATTASQKVGWGLELGYMSLGSMTHTDSVPGFGTGQTTRNISMWLAGPTLTVRLSKQRNPPIAFAGLAGYSISQGGRTTIYDNNGLPITGTNGPGNRAGVGLNFGAAAQLAKLSQRAAITVSGRVDLAYTWQTHVSAIPGGVEEEGDLLYPVLSVSAGLQWSPRPSGHTTSRAALAR